MADTKLLASIQKHYRYMLQSRYIDEIETTMTNSGEAFFHVSGAGHEAISILNDALIPEDWLHCHYRSKSLMLARGTPVEMFFLATLNKDTSHSRGRQMNAHMSDPALHIMSIPGPVGNNSLQAVGVAREIAGQAENPIVLCGIGDGTSQQGDVLEALGYAAKAELPVLFAIEDNSLAISTRTDGKTFFSSPDGDVDHYQGIPILHTGGSNIVELREHFMEIVAKMRKDRRPAIVHLKVDRLSHHTNADDQRVYRSVEEIQDVANKADPIVIARTWLMDNGVSESDLVSLEASTREEVLAAANSARQGGDPEPTFGAKCELPEKLRPGAAEYSGGKKSTAASGDASGDDGDNLTMLEAIRGVLKDRLETDKRVCLFGQDIEDPKGDVFGVTKGLSTAYPGRVENAPLAEASIMGISTGRALAGAQPVAFLQFADFFPIAYNHIFSELGTMFWRTDGAWNVPVIVMVTCSAYRAGLGPFHASSFESVAAHTPGIDVLLPSSAGDAAGLLNAAFESGRPTIFFYPKSRLNDRERTTTGDVAKQLVPIGSARRTREGEALTYVCWGNTVDLSERVADTMSEYGISSDVIDLRSINPWDIDMVCKSVEKTRCLLVVHEDNHTVGMGGEIVATVSEKVQGPITVRRITRPDTFVPCNFSNQLVVLPSYRSLLEASVELLSGSVTWTEKQKPQPGMLVVEAIGSSPSDESVTVTSWEKEIGEEVKQGEQLAELEADKASVELASPITGVLETRAAEVGESIKVGEPLLSIRAADASAMIKKQPTKEEPGIPEIVDLHSETTAKREYRQWAAGGAAPGAAPAQVAKAAVSAARPQEAGRVGIVDIAYTTGSRKIGNDVIVKQIPDWTNEDVIRRTGIENRNWIGKDESALTMAVDAVKGQLERHSLTYKDIDLIVCSTETPLYHTPSMATLVQNAISDDSEGFLAPAYDINAACTGYLYAMQIIYDFLQSRPDACALLVTAEALSTKLDLRDPATAPIFADASTSTIVVGESHRLGIKYDLSRPVTGANGENGDLLCVPIKEEGHIRMDGPRVFSRAVRDMITSLRRACTNALIELGDLSTIVAHQANQRILNAVSQRLKLKKGIMFSNIRNLGNTSSSTIPLALAELQGKHKSGEYIGLTAFGGGLTFGGATLRVR